MFRARLGPVLHMQVIVVERFSGHQNVCAYRLRKSGPGAGEVYLENKPGNQSKDTID